jgi:hypothetical protein
LDPAGGTGLGAWADVAATTTAIVAAAIQVGFDILES